METKITINAYGKINLGLDVNRRLENGYHEVRMIMQAVDLHDTITMEVLEKDEIQITANDPKIPCNEHNLAYKAAKLMKDLYQIDKGLHIHIEKRIPVAAGMAGGSTDCAAVLKGTNQLFDLKLSMQKLQEIGVKLGADVPYCIMGKTALSEGIGEILTPLKTPPQCVVLLAKPDIDVSTKYVYEHLNLKELKNHPDIDGMVKNIENGDLEQLCRKMSNVLETVTGEKYPVIGQIEKIMKEAGALQSVMSGSGPTVFGIFTDTKKAEEAQMRIRNENLSREVYITGFAQEN